MNMSENSGHEHFRTSKTRTLKCLKFQSIKISKISDHINEFLNRKYEPLKCLKFQIKKLSEISDRQNI